MAEEEKKVSRIKAKKKNWYKILAPAAFGSKEIGEFYLPDAQVGIGRTLRVNLREITGGMKDQHVYVSFQVKEMQGNNFQTEAIGYEMTPSYIKRMVRKSTSRLDDSFIVTVADGRKVQIKTLVVTIAHCQRQVCTSIRTLLRTLLTEELMKGDFLSFIQNLVGQKIQGGIRKQLSKVYPVREMAIRVAHLTR
ncbi:hypothetical protein HYX14_05250 [Candidatus Woesearchaeota archaeon]|nr:hypothetical protein [Candidatus Woesearchaeota archaeon]